MNYKEMLEKIDMMLIEQIRDGVYDTDFWKMFQVDGNEKGF